MGAADPGGSRTSACGSGVWAGVPTLSRTVPCRKRAVKSALIGFPGWPEPRNLKWRRDRVSEKAVGQFPGMEDYRRIFDSPFEGLRVITAWHEGQGWHLSISHPSRYPVWDEIRDARYELLPDACTMAMLLPPRGEYVALHPNCFHLHEIPGEE